MVPLAIGPGTRTEIMGFKCFYLDFKGLHCKNEDISVGGFDRGGYVVMIFRSSSFGINCLIYIYLFCCRIPGENVVGFA